MTATLLTNLHLATPEIFILSMASIILVVDLFLTEKIDISLICYLNLLWLLRLF